MRVIDACRGSGKLQGLAGPDPDQPRQAMDAVQGHSLGASALLVTATRLTLTLQKECSFSYYD